jgi:hypothetical protein
MPTFDELMAQAGYKRKKDLFSELIESQAETSEPSFDDLMSEAGYKKRDVFSISAKKPTSLIDNLKSLVTDPGLALKNIGRNVSGTVGGLISGATKGFMGGIIPKTATNLTNLVLEQVNKEREKYGEEPVEPMTLQESLENQKRTLKQNIGGSETAFESPITQGVGQFAGALGGEVLQGIGGITMTKSMLKAAPWLAKTLEKMPNLAQALIKGGMTGANVWGIKKAILPEDEKPGLEKLPTSMLLWGGGALGGELVSQTINKLAPQLSKIPGLVKVVVSDKGAQTLQVNPMVEGLVREVGENVAGTIAALPTISDEEKKQFIQEIGPEIIAEGVLDTLQYMLAKGRTQIDLPSKKSFIDQSLVPEVQQKTIQQGQKTPIDQFLESGTIESDIKTPIEEIVSGQSDTVQAQEIGGVGDSREAKKMKNTEEFKKWFEGSKVVDRKGEPLKVYHGTPAEFENFDKAKIGSNYGNFTQGIFFTDNFEEADYIANENYGKIENAKPNVKEAYLSIKNPIVVNVPESNFEWESVPTNYFDKHADQLFYEAETNGNDGIIINGKLEGKSTKLYVVFEPSQIKVIPKSSGPKKKSAQRIVIPGANEVGTESRVKMAPTEKDVVKYALSEGKPVPPEVLADYPELKAAKVEPEGKVAAKEPWEMTREEFISGVPKGFKYIADLGETIARYNPDGTITLTDAFFGHNEQTKKELLAHEKAHGIVKDVYANNENFWDLVNSGLFGKYDSDAMKFKGVPYAFKNVDEILTQLVTDLQVGVPKKFRDKYAVQYNIAQQILDGKEVDIRQAIQQALSEGKPVPSEVLAKYPDLKSLVEGPKKKSGLTEGAVDDNLRTSAETSLTRETPGGDERTGIPGGDSGLYNEARGGLDQTKPSPIEGGTGDTSELLTQKPTVKPPKEAVSVSSVSQKYISKAGFKNAEEAHIAFEAKQKGKEWFIKEFGNIENPDAVYQELIEKAGKLTPKEEKKIKFDLQFFAMSKKDLGKIAKERFVSDRAISQFRTNTIRKTEFFGEEAKSKLAEELFEYTPKSEKESLAEAVERVNRDMEGEMERLSKKDAFTGSDFDTYMLIGQRLEAEAKRTGDYTAFTKWMANQSLSANTEPARNLQAHVKYSRTSVGAINEAQSAVNAVEREIKKRNSKLIEKIDQETKEVKRVIKQTQKEMKGKTQEQILKEIRRRLENMLKDKPLKVRKTLYDRVIEAVKVGAYDDPQIRDLIKQSEGLPVLTPDDVKSIVEHMDKANKYDKNSEEYLREIYRVQKIIEDKSQATIHDKVRGVMQIALLGRVKTFIRNVVANPIFGGIERLSETTNARIANWIFDKVSKEKIGQQFSGQLVNKEFFKGLKGGFKNVVNDIGDGWKNYKALPENASIADKLKAFEKDWANRTDTSISRGQADLVRKRIFKNEAMQSTLDAIGYMLKIGDEPFVQGWKKQRIEELKRIHKTDTVTPEMETEAILYALDKTFQNESTAKEMALQLRRLANKIPLAGDIILPFATTPANIIDKTLEYTPLGLTKIVRDYGRLKRGDEKFNPRVFVQRMGRALTGTELLILGGLLFRMGIISGGDDKKSEKKRLFQQMSGEQDYSFKIGDQRYSYDWADPIGTILATGADMARNIEDAGTWAATLSALIQTTINTLGKKSFLQSVNKLFGYGDLGKGAEKTILGVPGMFMPGTITQFTPLTDKYVRDTKDKDPLKQTRKQLVSKIPFASRTLPPKIDLFGNKIEAYAGENDWFNVLINPGRYAKTSKAPVVKMIAELYERTKDSDVIPRVAPEKLTYNKETIQLTPEERRQFQKVMGKKALDSLNMFAVTGKNLSDEEKIKRINKLLDEAYNEAKKQLLFQKGIKLKTKKTRRSGWGSSGWEW